METFLLDLQTLLAPQADGVWPANSLGAIMSSSLAGEEYDNVNDIPAGAAYNSGFFNNIKAEFETLHANNRQEYAHMENERNRAQAAYATRDTALVNLICNAMNEMNNDDNHA